MELSRAKPTAVRAAHGRRFVKKGTKIRLSVEGEWAIPELIGAVGIIDEVSTDTVWVAFGETRTCLRIGYLEVAGEKTDTA